MNIIKGLLDLFEITLKIQRVIIIGAIFIWSFTFVLLITFISISANNGSLQVGEKQASQEDIYYLYITVILIFVFFITTCVTYLHYMPKLIKRFNNSVNKGTAKRVNP